MQINIVLTLQAVVPFLIDFLPAVVLRFLIAIHYQLQVYAPTYSMMFLNWAPLLNGLVAIVVVRPYRKALCRMLLRVSRQGQTTPQLSTAPEQVNPVAAIFTVTRNYSSDELILS